MKQSFLLLLILFTAMHRMVAQTFSNNDFKKLHWITGSWKMAIKNGALYEQWNVLNDSTLQSKGYIIKNAGDTVLLEAVQIRFSGKHLYYVPTINGQNNNEPVVFVFTACTGQSFTAENPGHDFPQKIYYVHKDNAAMYAAVSGNQKGKAKKEEFNYIKE